MEERTRQAAGFLILLAASTIATLARAQPVGLSRGDAVAWGMVDDVVRITTTLPDGSTGEEGFGFVFGQSGETLYVATADHVVRQTNPADPNPSPAKVQIVFYNDQGHRYAAEVLDLRLPYDRGDLAVIDLPRPSAYQPMWPTMADADALTLGTRAWRIGKLRRWVPATTPGEFFEHGSIWLGFDNLDTPPGSSGGPIVTEQGVIGMVVANGESSSAPSQVLPIGTIAGVVRDWHLPWNLHPPGFHLAPPLVAPRPSFGATAAPPPLAPPPPAAPPSAMEPTLSGADAELAMNLSDDDRSAVQRNLNALGYSAGPADGEFGSATRDALRAYQARVGLPSSGFLDRALQQRLALDSSRHAPQPTPSADASLRDFVLHYYQASAGPDAIEVMRGVMADRVAFYGQSRTRDQILAEEAALIRRWPARVLTVRPDSTALTCAAGGQQCQATGVVDYDMRSVERNALATGSERFSMQLDLGQGTPRIVGLNSVGLQRNLGQLVPDATRWTTRNAADCAAHSYAWKTTADTYEFTDQAGQTDVERVLQRGLGSTLTETVSSSHQGDSTPRGTHWNYVFDPGGQVHVRNLSTGQSFTLTRCATP